MHLVSGTATEEAPEWVSMRFHWYPEDGDGGPPLLSISSTYHIPDPEHVGMWKEQEDYENVVDLRRDEALALYRFLGAALGCINGC